MRSQSAVDAKRTVSYIIREHPRTTEKVNRGLFTNKFPKATVKSHKAAVDDFILFPTSVYAKLRPEMEKRTSPVVMTKYGMTNQAVLNVAS